ncbi:TonB-dependent siderophore receptor [Sphaerotilus sp.]|uniref:TonB-dependent siderophore receptor n=1 Tax=Sphaerotilus sp. TaxID=2093942 RepID=UPI002ACE1788|nr:TonB-dependent siderophore receptor [Sphaerotilus sp.]MDZ7855854.1 TonB-dependent siderophore receptor [Sphaerotilus sp.]
MVALPVLAVSVEPSTAQAQAAAQAPVPALHEFDIPAGALSTALTRAASAAGAPLTADAALTAGKSAPALKGRMTLREALAQLLAGSGLAAMRQDNGGWLLVRRLPPAPLTAPRAADETVLPVVRVKAGVERETATGPVVGYVARRSATGTKTDTSLLDTPQSVTVVTKDLITDTGAVSMQDALSYAAGVLSTPYGVDTRTDWMRVRGADPTVFLDGLRHAFGTRSARADPYTLERLEVLRGPAGTLYGAGTVAGVVNMVSKKPLFETQREVAVQYGSFNRRQLQMDLTGAIGQDGILAYRLVAVVRQADTQVDHVPDNRTLLAPSITWRPDASTSLTLLGLYQDDKSGVTSQFFPWEGTVLENPNGRLSNSLFIGEPTDYYDSQRRTIGWQLEHKFGSEWSLRQNFRIANNENDTVYHFADFYGNGTTAGPGGWSIDPVNKRMLRRYWWSGLTKQRVTAVDTHVEGSVSTGGLQHQLLFGTDYTGKRERSASTYGSSTIDAYAPVYGTPVAGVRKANPMTKEHQLGFYAQDQIKMAAWTVLAGLRHDRVESSAQGGPTDESSATTKRLAVMHGFDSGWTPYLSYAESFTPQSSINGRIFKPLSGMQWEAGVKYAPAGGTFALNAAIFDLKEKNRISETRVDEYEQLGKIKNRGVELEARSSIGRDLDLIANYNYVKIDSQLDGQPRQQASVWARYRFGMAGLTGFSAGAGLRYFNSFHDTANGGVSPQVSSVALVDLVFAYDIERWRYALNINNAGDRYYVSSCMTRGDCFLGARRNVVASATYRF